MNRIHKIIWSAVKEKWIVVSEKAGAVGCPIILHGALSIAALVALWRPAMALSPTELPTGGVITAGSGSISTSGSAFHHSPLRKTNDTTLLPKPPKLTESPVCAFFTWRPSGNS